MAPTEAEQHPRRALALAAHDASGRVTPIRISRRYVSWGCWTDVAKICLLVMLELDPSTVP